MMRQVIAAVMLIGLAGPALAQTPAPASAPAPVQTMTPEQTWSALYHQEAEGKALATLQVTALQRQIADLNAKLEAETKTVADMKAAEAAKTAPAK